MTTETEVSGIADKLTEAQRRAMLEHVPGQYHGSPGKGWDLSPSDEHSFARAGHVLMNAGLIEWHPNKRDARTCLTPLGLAVRDHLTKEPRK